MGKVSAIQWTDATWNVAVGCTKVDEDCKYCYMYRDSMNETRYNPREVRRTKTVFNLPLRIKEPSKIFVSSLTDWAHPAIDKYRNDMFEVMRKRPDHIYQLLTKRPERLPKILPTDWGEGWDNVWLGTSIGSNDSIHRANVLADIPAKIRFVSFEPLHGRINPEAVIPLDWVIVGGESGNETGKYRYRPCKIEWIEELIDGFNLNSAVFVKQLGTHLAKEMGLNDRHGGDINEWPEHLRIRQFPK